MSHLMELPRPRQETRHVSLPCAHCAQPQLWVSAQAARCLCPDCVAAGRSLPRIAQPHQTEMEVLA